MIRRRRILDDFEGRFIARGPGGHRASLRIFEALVREAVKLGALPLEDPLEGFEADVELARKLKVVRGTPPKD